MSTEASGQMEQFTFLKFFGCYLPVATNFTQINANQKINIFKEFANYFQR